MRFTAVCLRNIVVLASLSQSPARLPSFYFIFPMSTGQYLRASQTKPERIRIVNTVETNALHTPSGMTSRSGQRML